MGVPAYKILMGDEKTRARPPITIGSYSYEEKKGVGSLRYPGEVVTRRKFGKGDGTEKSNPVV